ncbi:methyl-accepting chemotaxis protein [Pseudovibrio sp. Tun.PSC04-5.I4]|uniref:methyl-accepting chemotaxis protein n=1 Tax=Pseudovibrio sp. Tun.PSC04-5.I4 TaxID=1798213 RepID=UPI0008867CE7|nr:methyl-accepting chemotaxis protein [Pseudovibrio sp. Tun.PSC04-5.I4]SDQ20232.1 Methyl-accepting chemotaxis protein [Pseudovibrio sp. Tun.PSC04-5.I4]
MLLKVRRVILHVTETAKKQADGDLEARTLVGMDGGELKELLSSVNYSVDKTDSFIREMVASTYALSVNRYYRRVVTRGLQGSFLVYANQVNSAISKVQNRISEFSGQTDAFEAVTMRVTKNLSNAGQSMSNNAHQMEQTADLTLQRASAVTVASEETSANVQTVSAAVEELSASSHEIGNQVRMSAQVTSAAVHEVEAGETKISSLSAAAETIGEVVALISSIAEQTHLLALNATIEAARAGDSGKGFAVVAGEVKLLAAQTSDAIGQISGQIDAIQSATAETVTSFQQVAQSISKIESVTEAISISAEQQAAATSEIAHNISEAYSGTRLVASNVSDVSTFANETETAAENVMGSAHSMNEQIASLSSAVNEYISELRNGPLSNSVVEVS